MAGATDRRAAYTLPGRLICRPISLSPLNDLKVESAFVVAARKQYIGAKKEGSIYRPLLWLLD